MIAIWPSLAEAQPSAYLQSRLGMGSGRYRAIEKEQLDVDEHTFLFGAMYDVEIGGEFGSERLSFMLGARLQYSLRLLQGVYAPDLWAPEVREQVHIPALFATVGGRVRIYRGLSALVQANIGPSFIIWTEHGKYEDNFWKFYLPIDAGFEYELPQDWKLNAGVSVSVPIYLSSAVHGFVGFRKTF